MFRIFAIAAPITLSATLASAGVVGSDAQSTDLGQILTVAPGTTFDNFERTPSANIVCTHVYHPDGSSNCRTISPETPSTDPLDELTVVPGSIFDNIQPTGPVPIACTDRFNPDGSRTCIFEDIVSSPINPINCTLTQTADGRLIDSCGPVSTNPVNGPVSTNPVNQVPAPGGLLLILAGLGIATRLRKSGKAAS